MNEEAYAAASESRGYPMTSMIMLTRCDVDRTTVFINISAIESITGRDPGQDETVGANVYPVDGGQSVYIVRERVPTIIHTLELMGVTFR